MMDCEYSLQDSLIDLENELFDLDSSRFDNKQPTSTFVDDQNVLPSQLVEDKQSSSSSGRKANTEIPIKAPANEQPAQSAADSLFEKKWPGVIALGKPAEQEKEDQRSVFLEDEPRVPASSTHEFFNFEMHKQSLREFYRNMKEEVQMPTSVHCAHQDRYRFEIRKNLLLLKKTFEGNLKDEFMLTLRQSKCLHEFLALLIPRIYSFNFKQLNDSNGGSISLYLIGASENECVGHYSGKRHGKTREALSVILLKKLNPIFLDWIQESLHLGPLLRELWVDVELIFVSDFAVGPDAILGLASKQQMTRSELARMIEDSASGREEMQFYRIFYEKTSEVSPEKFNPQKSIEENVFEIFSKEFQLQVFVVQKHSKVHTEMLFCTGKAVLARSVSATSQSVLKMKGNLLKAILKLVIKSPMIEGMQATSENSRHDKPESKIPVILVDDEQPKRPIPASTASMHRASLTTTASKPRSQKAFEPSAAPKTVVHSPSPQLPIDRSKSLPPEIVAAISRIMISKDSYNIRSVAHSGCLLAKLSNVDLQRLNFHSIEQNKDQHFSSRELSYLLDTLLRITLQPIFSEGRVMNVELMSTKSGGMFTVCVAYKLYPFSRTESLILEDEISAKALFEAKLTLLRKIYPKKKSLGKIVKHLLDIAHRETRHFCGNPYSDLHPKSSSRPKLADTVSKSFSIVYSNCGDFTNKKIKTI